jgi:hypothetical protein
VRIDRWSAGAWLLAIVGQPMVGGLVAAVSTVALARKLRSIPNASQQALRLAGLGHLHAGRSIANALTRPWWPLTVAAMLVSRRARTIAAVAAIIPNGLDWWAERAPLDPLRYTVLRLMDDVSYGAGVWVGCWRRRSGIALRPAWSRPDPAASPSDDTRPGPQPSAR